MRTWFAIVVGLVAGCVSMESVQCADGTVCPRDRMCRLIGDDYQCITDEQVAACEGKPDFEACAGGTCFDGVCLPPSCGDARVGPIEVCDDGNTASGDGCSPDCRSDETCGNGVVDLQVGEQCDDGALQGGLSHDGCSSTCLEEHPEWRVIPDYDELVGPAGSWSAVYDIARGRVVVLAPALNAMHTFEIEAGVWTEVSPLVSPAERRGFELAYDAHRQRVVMFGGLGLRDTWEWDGALWSLRTPTTTPPARAAHVMAYDAIGHRVVLFGGRSSLSGTNSELGDTWAWDGTEWIEITGPGPSKRSDSAMQFDPVRGVLVLYGGTSDLGDALADTWELDGTTWTQRSSAVDPGYRREHTMAFDPVSKQILAYGGRETTGSLSSTYSWNGTTWTLRANDLAGGLRPRIMTLEQEQRVMQIAVLGSYDWNGSGWTRLFTPASGGMRRGRVAAAADLDHRRVLVFGGYVLGALSSSTDLWRGMWIRITGTAPPARGYAAMAYDAARGEFVLFGGEGALDALDDTWVFDGAWTRRGQASVAPPARSQHTMVYDAKRQLVVLFGGVANSTQLGDTWTWNGTTWTEVAGAGPPARAEHTATYDPIREELILFGGYPGFGPPPFGDTWAWNGTWTKRSDVGPSPRFATGMAWDSARGRLVLFGGSNGVNDFNDVWEWDGSMWKQVAATSMRARSGHALVSSIDGAGVLRFGIDNQMTRDEIAHLRWSTEGPTEACVVGEDFDDDGRDGQCGGDPDCWRICTPMCPPGTTCPSGAIGCGDGVCASDRETCRSCPEDCDPCLATCGDIACNGGETHATCAADCP